MSATNRRGFIGSLFAGSAGLAAAGIASKGKAFTTVKKELFVPADSFVVKAIKELEKEVYLVDTSFDCTKQNGILDELYFEDGSLSKPRFRDESGVEKACELDWGNEDLSVCSWSSAKYALYLQTHAEVNKKFGVTGAQCHARYI